MQKIKAEIVEPDECGFGSRVETGALEIEYIGDDVQDGYEVDWPGTFIRGDDALMRYAPALTHLLSCVNIEDENFIDKMRFSECESLLELLQECAVKPKG